MTVPPEGSEAPEESETPVGGRADEQETMVVLVTGPEAGALTRIGRRLVEERLAACMNVVGEIRSIYRWEGEVVEEGESLALLKTTRARTDALEARVRELHAYEEPEVLLLRVTGGSASYMDWVAASVAPA